MNNLIPLMRRELAEHRAIIIAPAVFLGVILFAIAVGLVHSGRILGTPVDLSALRGLDVPEMTTVLGTVVLAIWVQFAIVGGVLAAFYLLDCLYADRKDRSVLFWKSLPISDLETVASKALTGLVSIPAVMAVFALACVLAMIPIGSVTVALLGGNPWSLIIAPVPSFSSVLSIFSYSLAAAVWFLPLAGYLMLCSAWAKRAPFLHAILIPVGIAFVEGLIFNSSNFLSMIGNYFGDFFETVGRTSDGMAFHMEGDEIEITGDHLHGLSPWAVFGRLNLYIGLAVGLAAMALAVRLRRTRIDAT